MTTPDDAFPCEACGTDYPSREAAKRCAIEDDKRDARD